MPAPPEPTHVREDSTALVIEYVRDRIARGEIGPGDRLPPERELAARVGVSRPTVRAGLRALSAMGVVESRHGSGTYIPSGPPRLGTDPLRFMADLHGFTREEMYEARRILEVGVAGLAAERALPEHMTTIAEEVANLFAAMQDPEQFLLHDIAFHRAVAAAGGNPLLGSIVEMVAALYYERRRETAARATDRNLQDAAEMHRAIFQAIRARNAERARSLMHEHLVHSAAYQAEEELTRARRAEPGPSGPSPAPRASARPAAREPGPRRSARGRDR